MVIGMLLFFFSFIFVVLMLKTWSVQTWLNSVCEYVWNCQNKSNARFLDFPGTLLCNCSLWLRDPEANSFEGEHGNYQIQVCLFLCRPKTWIFLKPLNWVLGTSCLLDDSLKITFTESCIWLLVSLGALCSLYCKWQLYRAVRPNVFLLMLHMEYLPKKRKEENRWYSIHMEYLFS
jgi:hypothetical protein